MEIVVDKRARMKDLGAFVRQRREDLGLTQVELAKHPATGYKFGNFITMVEAGQNAFPINRVPGWAEALKLPVEILLEKVFQAWHPDFIPYMSFHSALANYQTPDPDALARLVLQRRKNMNLTQSELAKMTGIKQNFIAMIENSSCNFPTARWIKFSEALNVPKHTLVEIIIQTKYPDFLHYITFHPAN
jgi:transcriptional regulator with XRE-family HTH domain